MTHNQEIEIGLAKQYDFYQIKYREEYKSLAIPQNESHYELIKRMCKDILQRNKVFYEIGFGAGLTLAMP